MSDTSADNMAAGQEAPRIESQSKEPLWQRALFMVGFWILGYLAFYLAIIMGVLQLAYAVLSRERNEELKRFSRAVSTYLGQCLAFITFTRDEKPFPFDKFPTGNE